MIVAISGAGACICCWFLEHEGSKATAASIMPMLLFDNAMDFIVFLFFTYYIPIFVIFEKFNVQSYQGFSQ